MAFQSYREGSKIDWGRELDAEEKLNRDDIRLGCLLRIADATEKMAANITAMQRELEYYKQECDRLKGKLNRANHSNAALKGHITRLKRNL